MNTTGRFRLKRIDGNWYFEWPTEMGGRDAPIGVVYLMKLVEEAKKQAAEGDVEAAHLLADYYEAEALRLRTTGAL